MCRLVASSRNVFKWIFFDYNQIKLFRSRNNWSIALRKIRSNIFGGLVFKVWHQWALLIHACWGSWILYLFAQNQLWLTLSKYTYFFPQRTRKGLLWAKFIQITPTKTSNKPSLTSMMHMHIGIIKSLKPIFKNHRETHRVNYFLSENHQKIIDPNGSSEIIVTLKTVTLSQW